MKTGSKVFLASGLFAAAAVCFLASCLAPVGILPGGGFKKSAAVMLDLNGAVDPNFPGFVGAGPNGTVAAPAQEPQRPGYHFGGWFADRECTIPFDFANTIVNETTVIYARWDAISWDVFFFQDENMSGIASFASLPAPSNPQVITDGEYALFAMPQPRAGYGFAGWFDAGDNLLFAFDVPVTQDHTLYAKWTAGVQYIYYDLNFEGGEIIRHQVSTGDILASSALAVPAARTGYDFEGWYETFDCQGARWMGGTISADKTVYAKWVVKTYPVIFIKGAEPARSNQTYEVDVEHGAAVPSITPDQLVSAGSAAPGSTLLPSGGWEAESGWGFIRWEHLTDQGWQPWNGDPVTQAFTFYGRWAQNRYTVTFECVNEDENHTNQTVTVSQITGGNVIPQSPELLFGNVPEKAGYTFEGWYTSLQYTTEWNLAGGVYRDMTLFAKWTLNTYAITFDPGTGDTVTGMPDPAGQQVAYRQYASLPAGEPQRAGHAFIGWGTSSDPGNITSLYDFDAQVLEGKTLYAKWYAGTLYTVRLVNPHTMAVIDGARTPQGNTWDPADYPSVADQITNDWRAVSWHDYTTGNTVTFPVTVNRNMILTAKTQRHTVYYRVLDLPTGAHTYLISPVSQEIDVRQDVYTPAYSSGGYEQSRIGVDSRYPRDSVSIRMQNHPGWPDTALNNGKLEENRYFSLPVEHGALAPQIRFATSIPTNDVAYAWNEVWVVATPFDRSRDDWRTGSQTGPQFDFFSTRITGPLDLWLPNSE
jgi:uncharacterized repeat protein (TIGR02543 family)